MNLRKLKNDFKEEIHKEDIKSVIITGLITMFLFSIALGLLNAALIIVFDFSTTLYLFFLGYFLSKRIKDSYHKYHILYPILSVLFLIIGLFIFNTISVFAYNRIFEMWYLTESLKLAFVDTINIFNPIYYITNFNVYELLYLLILLYTIFFTFRNSKKNYY